MRDGQSQIELRAGITFNAQVHKSDAVTSPTTNKTQQILAAHQVVVCTHRTNLMSIHDDKLFIILPCLFTLIVGVDDVEFSAL